MKHRLALLLCLALLLSPLPFARPGRSQSIILFPPPTIGLGFSAATIQPVADGIPIYTQGDNLWVESFFNATAQVELTAPNVVGGSSLTDLRPGAILKLYSFGQSDVSGTWTFSVFQAGGSPVSYPIQVVPPDSSLVPVLRRANLTGNQLGQTFSIPPTQAYDIQACSTGLSAGQTVAFGLAGIANGTLSVRLGQDGTELVFSQPPSGLTTWLELYSQYSYSLGNATTSQELLAAKSPPFTFSGGTSSVGANMSYPLTQQMPLRPGRFDLRVFMRTSAGLFVRDARFLRTRGGSWISLADCTSLVNVYSPAFALTTNLDSSNSSWPRHLFTMYEFSGDEAYSLTNLTSNVAVIRLKGSPGGSLLSGVTITASAPGLQQGNWVAYNSAVYTLPNSFPTNVTVTVSFGGIVTRTFSVVVPGPYSSKSLSVRAGVLAASSTLNGKALPNATFIIAAIGAAPVLIPRTGLGNLSILLPPDNYTLTASYGGNNVTEPFTISAGKVTALSLELSRPSFPTALFLLAIVAAAAIIANAIVWRRYLQRRKIYD